MPEFLMLAHTYGNSKTDTDVDLSQYLVSEKLDGALGFWDGGLTRGVKLPWLKKPATGLYSRNAKPFYAPDAWLDKLPPIPLVGELWLGFGKFQTTMSVVKRHTPSAFAWGHIKYKCFDIPSLAEVWRPRLIDTPNCFLNITQDLSDYMRHLADMKGIDFDASYTFEEAQRLIPDSLRHAQQEVNSYEELECLFADVIAHKGEGLMLRKRTSTWTPQRSHDLLKIKPANDSEGTVVGFISGAETDKGSAFLGMIGSVIIRWVNPQGTEVEFALSGMKTNLREFDGVYDGPPGVEVYGLEGVHFKKGQKITFKYRELTNAGKPKDARYWRHYICN